LAAGLMQVNIRIGSNFPDHDQMTLVVSFGGAQATANLWVR
jgi:uncharacterized protein (TIGR03437 family)